MARHKVFGGAAHNGHTCDTSEVMPAGWFREAPHTFNVTSHALQPVYFERPLCDADAFLCLQPGCGVDGGGRGAGKGAVPENNTSKKTFSGGCLGSRNDEERSEMRYVMRIAESSESSRL